MDAAVEATESTKSDARDRQDNQAEDTTKGTDDDNEAAQNGSNTIEKKTK
jgi:hypothetical protein